MKPPAHITVGGRPWAVKVVTQPRMIQVSEGDTNCLGLAHGNLLTIFVGDWLPAYMQREILLHEVLHACVFGGEFAGQLAEDVDHEEHYVSGLDAPLLATLRDNPALVRYLTA